MADVFNFANLELSAEMNSFEEDARNDMLYFFSKYFDSDPNNPKISQTIIQSHPDNPKSSQTIIQSDPNNPKSSQTIIQAAPNNPKSSQTTIEEKKSDRYSGMLDYLDFHTTTEGTTTWTEARSKYKPTPCETCLEEGKNYVKKLYNISFKEAIYKCENGECENGDFELVKVSYWDKPLAESGIDFGVVPEEILEYIPVVTVRDLLKLSHIVRYRNCLKNRFVMAKEWFKMADYLNANILEDRNALHVDAEPPTKADFFLDKVSDDELESVMNILSLIEKNRETKEKATLESGKNIEKEVESEPFKSELPKSEVKSEKDRSLELCKSASASASNTPQPHSQPASATVAKQTRSKKKNKKNTRRIIFYDQVTGNPITKGEPPKSGRQFMEGLLRNYNMLPFAAKK